MKRVIRNLIIGKTAYIESIHEYRQVMLSGQYGFIALAVIAFYIFMDIEQWHTLTESIVVYGIGFLIILVSLTFHRQQKHAIANFLLFPTFNVLLFLIVSSESLNTGAFVFFIPVSLGSFAVFNFTQRKIALGFALFSFILFTMAVLGPVQLLTFRNYSEEYIQLNQVINFSIAFPVSIMAVYLLISLNHENASQLLKSNQQLEKLNEELDRFVYSTSHDLRAPLLSVQGLVRLSSQTAAENERKQYDEMILQRLASLDSFIREITDYSRNNRLEITREAVQPATIANEIWESLKYSSDAAGIEFQNEIPSQLMVTNDSKRLRVVLANLIANAIRYHDARKENKYIRLHHQFTASSFTLHVEDNGQGISPELHSKIFDMFFRGNESSQGSGLGLYIVKETLAKLSGTIQLTSIPRQGSTFSIVVPHII
ncbi:MAG: HAMP domain-containing histidine kinase [Cyclobacteriaceae bacterium]|nr:HAMP domain-containing histidine kinase [Cyclobacteriaceae bacterium]